jgi:hypothetical protein
VQNTPYARVFLSADHAKVDIQAARAAAAAAMTHCPAEADQTAISPKASAIAEKRPAMSTRRCYFALGEPGVAADTIASAKAEGRSSVGRASVSKTECRRFESCRPCFLAHAETP